MTNCCNFPQFYPNKKAFHSNANRPLAVSPGYIVNKFENVGGGGSWILYNKVQVKQILTCPV